MHQLLRQQFVNQLVVDESEVTAKANFANDLGADELDMILLFGKLEGIYNISIPNDIDTVGAAIKYIEECIS